MILRWVLIIIRKNNLQNYPKFQIIGKLISYFKKNSSIFIEILKKVLQIELIKKQFEFLGTDFLEELYSTSQIHDFPAKLELIKEGQSVKFIPIVIEGLVKVYTMTEDRELLYYFMKPEQSCIMSISTIFKDGLSKVYAMTEEPSKILLIPSSQILKWIITYPKINEIIYKQYDLRYSAMMEMVNQAIFHRLDKRLLEYLNHRTEITGRNLIKLSHKDIANDLGTAREVISRLLKKFENEGFITQNGNGIEVIKKL